MTMSFTHEKRGEFEYFVPENIKSPATALFTTRLGGVSGKPKDSNDPEYNIYSLNLADFRGKYDKLENVRKNYEIIADTLGFSVNNIICAHQKHTDNILVCDEKLFNQIKINRLNLPLPYDYIYDAMVTDIPGILLSVRSADCIPILFWDEEHNAVGAAHCGWRGAVQKLQIKTALKMQELYSSDLSKLKAAIGPGISKCCYEVSKEDVFDSFVNSLGGEAEAYFEKSQKSQKNDKNNKYYCDLKGINKMLLEKVLKPENIIVSQNCTWCEENLFFSHRRQGEYRGTHAAFIGIKHNIK